MQKIGLRNISKNLVVALSLFLVLGALLGGCSSATKSPATKSTTSTTSGTSGAKTSTTAAKPTGVSLNQAKIRIAVEYQLQATVEPSGSDQTVTWTSSNPKIATVDNSGFVKAVKSGQVEIVAASKTNASAVAKCAVTVAPVPSSKGTAHIPLDDDRGSLKVCARCH